ncbi:MAG: xanthine dehydrogenase family protein subunit M [Dehalococcoidia bacterium]
MIPASFDYHAPHTLREAAALLRKYPGDARLVAGGQSLVPMMKLRLANPEHLVDLQHVPGLSEISESNGSLVLGAMATYRAIESSALVARRLPVLSDAMRLIADLQVRNRGTIGGSLAHADPGADLPALMVALEARIRTVGGRHPNGIAAERFFVDAFTTVLGPSEVLSEVRIPLLPAGTGASYEKFANSASRFAIVGVAAVVGLDSQGRCERVRIGVTGAGPRAVRAKAAERYLEGREPTPAHIEAAAQRAGGRMEFIGDVHGSPEYREHLVAPMTRDALTSALATTS